jgi:hypothetical protein
LVLNSATLPSSANQQSEMFLRHGIITHQSRKNQIRVHPRKSAVKFVAPTARAILLLSP